MIEIDLVTQLHRHVTKITIVAVVLEVGNIIAIDVLEDASRNGSFSRACPTTDPNYHNLRVSRLQTPSSLQTTSRK